ncbi:MAG: hypothetical protein POELPBGB_00060 [Bacteroidia bacterium]|nr:hypothetical protein [Bacteroidia bacterium]
MEKYEYTNECPLNCIRIFVKDTLFVDEIINQQLKINNQNVRSKI